MTSTQNQEQRLAFAGFLRCVAEGTVELIEWQRFAVTHYHDVMLEEIRQRVVRLSIERDDDKEWSDSEYESLQQWARDLRGNVLE